MKLEDKEKIAEALKVLEELKEQRGGSVLPFHKKAANNITLLEAFNAQYAFCNAPENTVLERKYRELILMALGCSAGVPLTVKTHANLAHKFGASIEEISEVLRLVFFYCGASKLIPSVEIFEELEGSEEL